MAIDKPRAGRCDAKLANGWCGKIPVPGTTRCLEHGGTQQLMQPLRESLYTRRLRAAFRSPEDQKLFDEIPKTTNLEEEIRICRMQIVKYQEMLERGEEWIYTDKQHNKPIANQIADDGEASPFAKVTENAKSIRDLLESHLDTLRRLAATQADLRPGSEIGGNLRITINVAGEHRKQTAIPDLTGDADATHLLPPPTLDSSGDLEDLRRHGNGYDDDGE